MKISRSTLIPLILGISRRDGIYRLSAYADGRTSALYYFGVIATTVVVIILLHFNLKHRERLRRERLKDMEKAESQNEKITNLQ